MSGYQWTVVFAAWLGWGFDVFDGLLFNFRRTKLHSNLTRHSDRITGSGGADSVVDRRTDVAAAARLGAGGILFGRIADRLGRTRTLMITMLLYAFGTALCAFAPNVFALAVFRFIASLGIGGEWAAGAAMVAEAVPEKRRIEAGALLYTSAPLGLALATLVNYQVSGVWMRDSPELAWRVVFLSGLLPAAVALIVRFFVKEPERWAKLTDRRPPRVAELFEPGKPRDHDQRPDHRSDRAHHMVDRATRLSP
jgi:MFS family permease